MIIGLFAGLWVEEMRKPASFATALAGHYTGALITSKTNVSSTALHPLRSKAELDRQLALQRNTYASMPLTKQDVGDHSIDHLRPRQHGNHSPEWK